MPDDAPKPPPRRDAPAGEPAAFELAPDDAPTQAPRFRPGPPTAEELTRLRQKEDAELAPGAGDATMRDNRTDDDADDADDDQAPDASASQDAEGAPARDAPPLARHFLLKAEHAAIFACGLTIGAGIVGWVVAEKGGFAQGVSAVWNTLVFSMLGVGAIWATARVEARPVGSYAQAMARMFAAVAVFQLCAQLRMGIPGRIGEAVLAVGAYLGCLFLLFGWSPRVVARVAAFHFVLALVVWLTILVNRWALNLSSSLPPTPSP